MHVCAILNEFFGWHKMTQNMYGHYQKRVCVWRKCFHVRGARAAVCEKEFVIGFKMNSNGLPVCERTLLLLSWVNNYLCMNNFLFVSTSWT